GAAADDGPDPGRGHGVAQWNVLSSSERLERSGLLPTLLLDLVAHAEGFSAAASRGLERVVEAQPLEHQRVLVDDGAALDELDTPIVYVDLYSEKLVHQITRFRRSVRVVKDVHQAVAA